MEPRASCTLPTELFLQPSFLSAPSQGNQLCNTLGSNKNLSPGRPRGTSHQFFPHRTLWPPAAALILWRRNISAAPEMPGLYKTSWHSCWLALLGCDTPHLCPSLCLPSYFLPFSGGDLMLMCVFTSGLSETLQITLFKGGWYISTSCYLTVGKGMK